MTRLLTAAMLDSAMLKDRVAFATQFLVAAIKANNHYKKMADQLSAAPITHTPEGSCPCCNDALQRIKSNLLDISKLVAEKLPSSIAEELDPSLVRIRQEGKVMLSSLGQSLSEGAFPSRPDQFDNAVQAFGRDIDRLALGGGMRGLDEKAVYRLYALRFGFDALVSSVNDLMDGLSARPPEISN